MRHPHCLALGSILGIFLASCGPPSPLEGGRLLVMSYNVLSLFDGQDDGGEYPDFSVARSRWSESAYRQRLANLARVIRGAGPGLPDLVALQEVEGQRVMADLAALLRREGYAAYGAAQGDSAICCAILSRLPLLELRSHLPRSSGYAAQPGTRAILEARLYAAGGREICVMVNHWKSRLEGAEETEDRRIDAAALLADLVRQRRRESPEALILACGDFNEAATAHEDGGRAFTTAFARPDSDGSPRPSGSPILILSAEEWDSGTGRGDGGLPLLSPWFGLPEESAWSYAWRERKERIDMILIEASCPAEGFLDFGPSRAAFLLDGEGLPLAWDSARGSGFSDHLPLFLEMDMGL